MILKLGIRKNTFTANGYIAEFSLMSKTNAGGSDNSEANQVKRKTELEI